MICKSSSQTQENTTFTGLLYNKPYEIGHRKKREVGFTKFAVLPAKFSKGTRMHAEVMRMISYGTEAGPEGAKGQRKSIRV